MGCGQVAGLDLYVSQGQGILIMGVKKNTKEEAQESPPEEKGKAPEMMSPEAPGGQALATKEQDALTTEEQAPEGQEAAPPSPPPDPNRKWYVVHTYAGYENKVKNNLTKRIETMGMKEKIFSVLVPTEDELEIKDGKKKLVQKKIFPGYVLVEMIMEDASWYVVRNTAGVTGFVGSGTKPTPLPEEEVQVILKQSSGELPRRKVALKVGEKVRITTGPFVEFYGAIQEVNPQKEKIRVLVSIFGRETPVELDYGQVEKL